jgi:hypothetical protein
VITQAYLEFAIPEEKRKRRGEEEVWGELYI